MQQMRLVSIGIFLIAASIEDYRTKRISVVYFGITWIVQILLTAGSAAGAKEVVQWQNFVPGVLLLIVGLLSDQVGVGDGLGVILMGFVCPAYKLLMVLSLAMLLLGVWGIIGIIAGRCSHKDGSRYGEVKIPFYPFLTGCFFLVQIWGD